MLTAPKNETNYAALAAAHGLSPGAVRVAAHRLRRRFREVFHEEIAHTVSDPAEIEQEVRYLLGVLAS